jgi:hypothetical protein
LRAACRGGVVTIGAVVTDIRTAPQVVLLDLARGSAAASAVSFRDSVSAICSMRREALSPAIGEQATALYA